jgi:pimeloyl-ACP methyl ester carboxylesterase
MTRIDGVDLDVSWTPAEHAGDRPPLVFLHEGLGSIAQWRSFPADLRAGVGAPATLVYSRAGYGRSGPATLPRPVTYMHHEADVVLPALLADVGLEAPVLVGHSDGASIALLYAGGGRPVTGLVLLAPHVFVERVTISAIESARETFATSDLRERLAKYHDDPEATFRGWNDVWLSPGFRAWDIRNRLAAITSPILLVQGEQDPYGTTAQLDAIAAGASGPVARALLPDVGHVPHLEAPDATLAAVTEFVRGL